MKKELYAQPLDREIFIKILSGWGLKRLFLWSKGKCQVIGETLLISQILRISKKTKKRFTRNEINSVIALCEEHITKETRLWLYEAGGV